MAGVKKEEGTGNPVSTRRRESWHRDLQESSRMRRAGGTGTKQSFKKEAEIHKGQGCREIKRYHEKAMDLKIMKSLFEKVLSLLELHQVQGL